MHDGWPRLIVLLARYPHLLKCRERSEDRTSNPSAVLSLWGCDDSNLHAGGRQSSELFVHSVGEAGVHCSSASLDSLVRIYHVSQKLRRLTRTMFA